MKNHIAIKFIAIVLCAASLLGAVGGAVGVFALTEMDLYSKTVDQVYQERIQSAGENLAYSVAMNYASGTLGGCPEEMLGNLDSYTGSFQEYYCGYELKDAEGNVLVSHPLAYGDSTTTYTFPITGQYMHLVETTSASQQAAQQAIIAGGFSIDDTTSIYDAIPAEGAVVTRISLSLSDGTGHGVGSDNLGTVFHNQDGLVVLRCAGWIIDGGDPYATVTSISLYDWDENLIYSADSPDGVGYFQYDDRSNDLIFTSFYTAITAAEPMVVEETVVSEAAAVEETVYPPVETESADVEETVYPPVETVPADAEETVDPTAETEAAEAEETSEATTAEEEDTDSTEAAVTQDTDEGSSEETAEAAETDSSEEAEEDSGVEAAAYSEDSEAEPAAEGTEATEAAAEPTIPETIPEETAPKETLPEVTEPVMINGKALNTYQVNRTTYWDSNAQETVTAKYVYVPMPEMTLELTVAPGALVYESSFTLLRIVRELRNYLFPMIGICLLVFAVCAVYLCCAAGRKPKSVEVCAGGLNRLPLDLYGFLAIIGVSCCYAVIAEGPGEYLLRQNATVALASMAAMGYLASLIIVGFLYALVAQVKMPGGFWWRNSLFGWCLKLIGWMCKKCMVFAVWLEEKLDSKGLPALKRLCKWVWGIIAAVWLWFWNILKRIYRWMTRSFDRFLSLLPLTWQWLLAGFAMFLLLAIVFATNGEELLVVLCIGACVAIILYGSHCFGTLWESTKRMNKGDLDSKVDDRLMVGCFKDFAGDLNDLAGVAVVAAQKQLKSERMKTELITNVSHDIKTPLTSIINYVDLLQKPHTEEEQEAYLEVLSRQSLRLKKLIDDLMDMSKASTGNMAVDITLVDAVESVNQALGEFADKLEKVQLTPIFRHTEESVAMMADGRLVWRVLSNLLSNAVKYALPGTRLYIDLMSLEGKVVISLKNISRDELNVDAEELMERFVRGDDSRNTEGSGLGLNIAKSLMELQKGQLQLLVDGDLFKVTLIFPGL